MESITTALKTVARCEGSLLSGRPERVGMSALIQEALPPLKPKAHLKKLAIVLDLPKNACWFTDVTAIRPILINLLVNAIEYSPAATSVRVRIESNGTSERPLISNITDNLVLEDLPTPVRSVLAERCCPLAQSPFRLGPGPRQRASQLIRNETLR